MCIDSVIFTGVWNVNNAMVATWCMRMRSKNNTLNPDVYITIIAMLENYTQPVCYKVHP